MLSVVNNYMDDVYRLYSEEMPCTSGEHEHIVECKSSYYLGEDFVCDFMIYSDFLHCYVESLTDIQRTEYFTEHKYPFAEEFARYICRGNLE